METMYNQVERAESQQYSFYESLTIILHLIKNDINRFGSLQRHMPKISKKVLTSEDDSKVGRDKLVPVTLQGH